ncbi:hypothetical protein IJJ97_00705 [bacterium]|nr:hypothetical protein [bacterium]
MNIGFNSNNISMMSSMVGIPHKAADGAKQISKESGSSSSRVGESSEGAGEGGSAEVEEESSASSGVRNKQASNKSQRAQQQSTARVSRKRVSDETVLDTKNKAGETAESKETGKAVAPKQAQKTAGTTTLDNAKQIQYSFSKTMDEANAGNETKQRPEVQRKKFAQNLRKWVDVEYKQYVKDSNPLYSRRNLREILNALGNFEAKTNKSSKKDDAKNNSEVSFSSFNKYNVTQATKTLHIFDEIQVPDNYEAFELVA